jgi:hypothetical protein
MLLHNKKTQKLIWVILAILVLPAFLFWGFGSFVRSREQLVYTTKIFGRRIQPSEYQEAMEAVRNQAIMQLGDNFSKMQKYLNLEAQAWERIILLIEAKKRKIRTTDKEVTDFLRRHPLFQANGSFNTQVYSQMLQYAFHAQPRAFEEQTRQNIILGKLYNNVAKEVNLTDAEIRQAYQKENEKISIYYIASAPSEFTKDINPQNKELEDYFAKNPLEFKQPLSFNIEYVYLDSEEKINSFIRGLKKGNFDKLAKDYGLTVKETGLFAQDQPIPGIGWSPEILNLISKYKIGQISVPVHIDKYYYVLRLKEKKEPYIPEYNAVKKKVREVVIRDISQNIAREKINDCLKRLNQATSGTEPDFDKAAKEYGLKSNSTDFFKYGSYIEGIGASDIFFAAVKELKEGASSGVIESPGGFYIIKLKSRVPVDEKKFEAEKKEFTGKLISQRKEEYFMKFLEELKRRALGFKN